MAKLVDALDLGSSGAIRGGSSPPSRTTRWAPLALMIVLRTASANATAPPLPRPESTRRFLPATNVSAIAQDSKGHLWIGTDRGLARFDGLDFHWQEGHSRLDDAVQSIVIDPDDTLWIGLRQPGTVLRMRNNRVDEVVVLGEPPLVPLTRVLRGPNNTLYTLSSLGLHQIPLGATDTAPLPVFENQEDWRAIDATFDAKGNLWIGTTRGFARVEQGKIRLIAPVRVVHNIHQGPSGTFLVNTSDGPQAFLPESETWARLLLADGTAMEPSILYYDSKETTWLSAGSGANLQVVANGTVYPATIDGMETGASVAFEDREGNVWFGSATGGLLHFRRDHPFRLIGRADGLEIPVVFSIAPAASGGVWMTSPTGLVRWKDGDLKVISVRPLTWPGGLRGIFEDADGSVILPIFHESVLRYREGVLTDVGSWASVPDKHMHWAMRTRDGTLVLGQSDGKLIVESAGERRIFDGAPSNCGAPAYGACEDPNGTLWLATSYSGLCEVRRDKPEWSFHRYGFGKTLPTNRLNAIHCDGNDLWIGTAANGLVRKRGDVFVGVDDTKGLRSNHVGAIVPDRASHLWVSSQRGIERIDAQQLNDVADGKLDRISGLPFDIDDGMGGNTVVSAFPPSGSIDRDGAIWFPTLQGAVVFPDPSSVKPAPVPTPIFDRVTLDGRDLALDDAPILRREVGLGNLVVTVTASTFVSPHRLRFRYRLIGFDRNWIEAGSRRTAYYTNLPAGVFRFELQVTTAGNPVPRQTSLDIVLVPPFYRTPIFTIILILATILLILFFVRIRLWQQRLRFAAVVDERERIARDMHDTLEQSLVASRLQLDAAEAGMGRPGLAEKHIGRARELVDRSMREAKASIWALRAGLSDEADLRAALSAIMGQALSGTRVQFHLGCDREPYRLEPEAERQMVRIAQEAVTNALKHGAPKSINIELRFTPTRVEMSIQDDGTGFDAGDDGVSPAGKPGAHYGLRGMHERAQTLAGTMQIHSRPLQGTVVTVSVPATWRRGSGKRDKNGRLTGT
jgi:ligand-binding sensor domain-containing protein/signal transduction histidine kinase